MKFSSTSFGSAFKALGARVRFVLVQPSHPGNIGSSARALRTMGFERLSVVAPHMAHFAADEQAIALATHGLEVLQAARVCTGVVDALQGSQLAFAMTGYAREFGPPLCDVRAAAEKARAVLAAGGEVAFVFGTERSGLSNEDVERCTDCCAIPADPECASLNLSQAVQIVAYEMQLALRAALGSTGVDQALQPFAAEPAAAVEQIDGMVTHLEQALLALGYLSADDPRRLSARLRRLFGRARPTLSEIDILRGMAAAIIERKSDRIGKKDALRR